MMNNPNVIAACFLLVAAPAAAVRTGVFGATGERAAFNCVACHTVGAVPPVLNVSGVNDASPGESLAISVSVVRGEGSPGVAAGIGLATSSAGIFFDPDADIDDIRIDNDGLDNQVAHVVPKPYDGSGSATFNVLLTDLREGRHTLFVGVNDSDGNLQPTNDRALLLRVPFAVCDTAAADDDDDGFTGLCDLCPQTFEATQQDTDNDGSGDACDNCVAQVNRNQSDLDADGIGDLCDPVTDECALALDNCNDNADCTDEAGIGFGCACKAGFLGNGLTCDDVDECADDPCDILATCENTPGSFVCTCGDGYGGDGLTCEDVNECDDDPCDDNAVCDNTVGSFACACTAGFTGDGLVCTDVDECVENNPCAAIATCENVPGSVTCFCPAGFSGDGTSCADIDECAAVPGPCDDDEVCSNSDGSFDCEAVPSEGEGEGEGEPPVCGAAPGSSFALVGLLVLLVPRRRIGCLDPRRLLPGP